MKRILAGISGFVLSAAALAATLNPVQLLNPAGSTAGQAIVSTGASTAPAWGNVTASALAPVAANTVIANPTSGTAAPTAHAVPSCSTANSALKWTSGTGLSCGTTFALTSGDLSQFASTTSAQLAGVISNETGSGALVFGTSPSLTTPTIAGATLSGTFAGGHTYSGAVTFSSTITPSSTAGIVGTMTNDNANAGSVGEFVSSSIPSGSAVSLTTSTYANVTSVALTAGDWDCRGNVVYNISVGASQIQAAISTTSGTLPTLPAGGGFSQQASTTASINAGALALAPTRISLSGSGTVYLLGFASFASGTASAYGFLGCRRPR